MLHSEHAQLIAPTTLEIVRLLPGPIERVWDHLTQSNLKARWFCAGDVEPRQGGSVVMDFDHARLSRTPGPPQHETWAKIRLEGQVTCYDPPHRLSFTWPDANGGNTEVRISLETIGDQVRLHLIHDRLTSLGDRTGAAAGWHAHLEVLRDILGGQTAPDFWPLHTALEVEYETRFTPHK